MGFEQFDVHVCIVRGYGACCQGLFCLSSIMCTEMEVVMPITKTCLSNKQFNKMMEKLRAGTLPGNKAEELLMQTEDKMIDLCLCKDGEGKAVRTPKRSGWIGRMIQIYRDWKVRRYTRKVVRGEAPEELWQLMKRMNPVSTGNKDADAVISRLGLTGAACMHGSVGDILRGRKRTYGGDAQFDEEFVPVPPTKVMSDRKVDGKYGNQKKKKKKKKKKLTVPPVVAALEEVLQKKKTKKKVTRKAKKKTHKKKS